MDAPRVLELLDHLSARDISVWIDGGWGVDALLGHQTRPHDDLDLITRLDDLDEVEQALHELGYVRDRRTVDNFAYLVDAAGHQVDVHAITTPDTTDACPTEVGRILGREVPVSGLRGKGLG